LAQVATSASLIEVLGLITKHLPLATRIYNELHWRAATVGE